MHIYGSSEILFKTTTCPVAPSKAAFTAAPPTLKASVISVREVMCAAQRCMVESSIALVLMPSSEPILFARNFAEPANCLCPNASTNSTWSESSNTYLPSATLIPSEIAITIERPCSLKDFTLAMNLSISNTFSGR